jgi:transcriptional regulator with XRE-family HTH domain
MKLNPEPKFEMRHRMQLALEYGSVNVNQMARELGVSRTTISNYLHGRTKPSRGHLIAWAMRCGVPFGWLAGEESGFLDIEPIAAPVKSRRKAKTG